MTTEKKKSAESRKNTAAAKNFDIAAAIDESVAPLYTISSIMLNCRSTLGIVLHAFEAEINSKYSVSPHISGYFNQLLEAFYLISNNYHSAEKQLDEVIQNIAGLSKVFEEDKI